MKELLKSYSLKDEGYLLKNLLIFPVISSNNGNGFVTSEEALQSQTLRISEKNDVNSIELEYTGNQPLVLVEGEQILGAWQNRAIATTVLMQNPRSVELPVVCIEEGRWAGEKFFSGSGDVIYPSLRSYLLSRFNQLKILRNSRDIGKILKEVVSSSQTGVWNSISNILKNSRITSLTKSLTDAYNSLQSELDLYIEELEEIENMAGFVAFIGGEFVGMDIFYGPETFKKFSKKVLKGYALEALTKLSQKSPVVEKNVIHEIWDQLTGPGYSKFKAIADGVEWRKKNGLTVRALVDNERLIHLSAFPPVEV